jgi:hypothetical protein
VHEVNGIAGACIVGPSPQGIDRERLPGRLRTWRDELSQLSTWPPRRWAVAAIAAGIAAVLMGSPTDLVPTNLFQRMTPILWWNYPVWILSALLLGLVVATYVRTDTAARRDARPGRTITSGIVTVFAVGCPICNKLVVLALGTSGALDYFSPVQPILGIAAVGLLAATLMARLRRLVVCSAPSRPGA